MRKKSMTPIGDQAGKEVVFFKRDNLGIGYGAGKFIKEENMRKTDKRRIKELEDRVKRLENDTIPACRIIVRHRSPNVVTGQEFSVQEFAKLLLDELNLAMIRIPTSVKLEKTAGKGGPGSKLIKGE